MLTDVQKKHLQALTNVGVEVVLCVSTERFACTCLSYEPRRPLSAGNLRLKLSPRTLIVACSRFMMLSKSHQSGPSSRWKQGTQVRQVVNASRIGNSTCTHMEKIKGYKFGYEDSAGGCLVAIETW